MMRTEYIKSRKGQLNLRLHRKVKRQYYIINQQPKSKGSISIKEKEEFQQQILKQLDSRKRRAYRAPVIMEIDFTCNQNNPPAIHTLAKNYLDLLCKPLETINTKRKRLLYNDDRLVKVLIVNRWCNSSNHQISIKIDRFNNFVQDLKLCERIIHNDFDDADGFNSFDISEIEDEGNDRSCDAVEELKELRANKGFFVKAVGPKAYEAMEALYKQDVQEDFLKIGNLRISALVSFFAPTFNKKNMSFDLAQSLEKIQLMSRNMIISPPLALDLKHTPVRDGQTHIFKNNVKYVLKYFLKQFPLLSPLKIPLGVIVLYVPPRIQSIDLDNLARYVIPFVNEIVQPTTSFTGKKVSIRRYQFIELPRFDSDADSGYVRLIFDNPFLGNIWSKVENVIEKWAKD